jgi:hypothetical protein
MLSWLFRGRNRMRSARSGRPKRIRLSLEALESRYCPSGPAITAFTASAQGQGETVLLTGSVSDPGATSISVNFQGAASGTATVTNGTFSLQTQATALGTISAQATDNSNLVSAQVSTQLSVPPPTITFTVSQEGGHMVLVSGQVTAQEPGGLTVSLSGVVSATATTGSSGSFSWTGDATSLGQINSTVTDVWGQTGNGNAQLTDTPPTITYFRASYQANGGWLFTGEVNAEFATGLTVTLTNVPDVGTVTVTVGSNSLFSYLDTAAPASANSTVTATVTDDWGLVSQPITATMGS